MAEKISLLEKNKVEILAKERPYSLMVIQTQILYDLASMMENLLELSKKPEGRLCPINLTVTEPTYIDFVRDYPGRPLFSISIFNDGPGSVYPGVNEVQDSTPLKSGESVRFEYTSPKIRALHLYINEGETAVIRGFGVY